MVMRSFRDVSIRTKLMLLLVGVVSVALLLSYGVFAVIAVRRIEGSMANHLLALADVLGANCTAALSFEVPSTAKEVLQAIDVEPNVVFAQVYDRNGIVFATHSARGVSKIAPPELQTNSSPFSQADYIHVFRPIKKDQELLGTLYLQANREQINTQLRQITLMVVMTLILSFAVTLLLSIPLTNLIARPMLRLAEASRMVGSKSDFTIRVEKVGNDELGTLCDAFNAMLAQIEQRDMELENHRSRLEEIVEARTADLATKNVELARSNGELQQFAFVASHDLQEPLRKIQAFSDMLQSHTADRLDAESRDYLSRMQSAATRMRTLIDGLLGYSRIVTKGQAFEAVDLADIASKVVTDLETRIQQTGGKVEIGDLPTVDADPLQMRQLLQNLIGNALKFHRPEVPPVVKVTASLVPLSTRLSFSSNGIGMACRIVVEDNGIGFEEKYAERIFTPFQRLHGRFEFEGTGMGLAICRKIAERHHGTIIAHGRPSEGSEFVVTLPVRNVP